MSCARRKKLTISKAARNNANYIKHVSIGIEPAIYLVSSCLAEREAGEEGIHKAPSWQSRYSSCPISAPGTACDRVLLPTHLSLQQPRRSAHSYLLTHCDLDLDRRATAAGNPSYSRPPFLLRSDRKSSDLCEFPREGSEIPTLVRPSGSVRMLCHLVHGRVKDPRQMRKKNPWWVKLRFFVDFGGRIRSAISCGDSRRLTPSIYLYLNMYIYLYILISVYISIYR